MKARKRTRTFTSVRGGRLTVDGPDQDGDFDLTLMDSMREQETEIYLSQSEANDLIFALGGRLRND